jgi:hypothetical protein
VIAPFVVAVGWTASLDDAPDGYVVERRDGEGVWSQLADLDVEMTSYNDSSITAGGIFEYRVGAFNTGGTSYNTTYPTVSTIDHLLLGFWNAPDALNQTGADSSSIIFDYNADFGGFIYRRTDYYDSIDSEDIEEGVYTADGLAITWTAVRVNGDNVTPFTYSWNYSMDPSGEAMTVEYDWGEGAFDVDFVYVPPPPVD